MNDTERARIILAHAGHQVPRYTSYPTAPHFTSSVDSAVYRRWLSQVALDTPVSLYLHVPFCRTMCWYCGCHTKATARLEPVERYLDILEQEIDLVARLLPGRLPVVHVHWGGGSPTLMRGERMLRIMARLRRHFNVISGAEVAIEVDPRTLREDLLAAMPAAGINRASIGVQTCDADVQAAINRVQAWGTVVHAVERLRASNVGGLNVDLLYGLPRQTADSTKDTACRILELAPDRVSVFGYAHVPHMKPHQRMIDEATLPGPAERLAQADAIADVLCSAGYVAIGLDHFALPDDPMAIALDERRVRRNFQGYTTDSANVLIGFGTSAIGHLAGGYVQNAASTRRWEAAIAAGQPATARGLMLSDEDRLRRAIIGGLMCSLEVDLSAAAAEFCCSIPIPDLADLETQGIVRRDGDRITIDPAFRPLARVVASAFDARLDGSKARHALAV